MSDAQELTLTDDIEQFDLTCPACGTDLLADQTYNDWRVCGRCGRHFWVSARERAAMIARSCDVIELPYFEPQVDPVEHHQRLSPADRQGDARERSALSDAVVTARVSFDGGSVIAVLTHPTGGNLLGGVAVNADIRLAEPGIDGSATLVPDEVVARPDLIGRVATILDYLRRRGGPDVVLAGSSDAASARLATFQDRPAVVISIQSNEWQNGQHWSIVRRAQRTAANLELPIVFAISGATPLSLDAQVEIRDLLLRHRRPVIGIIQGDLTSAHVNLLAVDTAIAAADLAIPGSKAKRYSAQEGRAAGMVDVVAGSDLALPIARAIEESARLTTMHRIERRLRQADRRGSEVPESRELTRLELLDLREVQATLMRSVEEWRHRFGQREFTLPTIGNFQGLPAFRNMTLPKMQVTRTDLTEMRDKWMARRRSGPQERNTG